MPIAAVVSGFNDLAVRLRQQVPGALKPQFRLMLAQGQAELLPEKPVKMALAAVQLRSQMSEGLLGQFCLRHPADQLAKALFQNIPDA